MAYLTKARLSARAKKAWRTRKLKAKNKKPDKTKRQKKGRSNAKKTLNKITKFIQKDLRGKIIQDLKEFRISSEADLRTSITFWLRKSILPNPRYSKYRLATELRVRRQAVGKPAKKGVDVAIQYLPTKTFTIYKPDIMIEIKENKNVVEKNLRSDIKKLKRFYKSGVCKRGFIIYLCRMKEGSDEKPISDKELEKEASKIVGLEFKDRIIPIIINAYDNMSHAHGLLFDERWKASSDYQKKKETAAKAARTRKRRKRK